MLVIANLDEYDFAVGSFGSLVIFCKKCGGREELYMSRARRRVSDITAKILDHEQSDVMHKHLTGE